jgi:hypothetical protein
MEKPTKTFGIAEPVDLYRKLLYDIERLQAATMTRDVQYAAFDCAVDANHLVDWVLHAVDDATHVRLTGKEKGKHGIIQGFGKINEVRLPDLEMCRQIANSVKHVVVTFGPPMDHVSTSTTVRFEPNILVGQPIPKDLRIFAWAYVTVDGIKHSVIDLFTEMATQWERFLKDGGLFVEELDYGVETNFDE